MLYMGANVPKEAVLSPVTYLSTKRSKAAQQIDFRALKMLEVSAKT